MEPAHAADRQTGHEAQGDIMNGLSQRWRWTVPGVVAAAVALVVGVRPVIADASPTLPPRTAAQLLASLPDAASHPFSGTVKTTAHLGLPDLPSSVQGQHAPVSATALLTGTHTLRVWYAGPDRQRIALVNDLAEADLIHSGQDVWAWNSDTKSGVHLRLPDHQAHGSSTPSGDATSPMPQDLMNGLTPQGMAQKLLAAIDPTTAVRVDGTAKVAGRKAYELVVSPRDNRSLVRQIRLAVDSRTSLPLRLQVFSTRSAKPAIQTGFTSIHFATPAGSVFRAPDVPLRELTVPDKVPHTAPPSTRHPAPSLRSAAPRVHGSGWTAVVELTSMPDLASLAGGPAVAPLRPRAQGKGDTDGQGKDSIVPAGPPDGSAAATSDGGSGGQAQMELLQSLLRSATPVTGPYGSGRLLRTALVSVLVLDNGHVFIGAVTPATLEQVATSVASERTPSSSPS
jgi:outer membrane lipoprotein-sorting protein